MSSDHRDTTRDCSPLSVVASCAKVKASVFHEECLLQTWNFTLVASNTTGCVSTAGFARIFWLVTNELWEQYTLCIGFYYCAYLLTCFKACKSEWGIPVRRSIQEHNESYSTDGYVSHFINPTTSCLPFYNDFMLWEYVLLIIMLSPASSRARCNVLNYSVRALPSWRRRWEK